MYVCMYVCMSVCTYVRTYVYMYVCVFATLFRVPSQNQRVADARKCGFDKICGSICLDFRTRIPNLLWDMLSNCRGLCSPDYGCCTLGRTSRPGLPGSAATKGGAPSKRLHCTQACLSFSNFYALHATNGTMLITMATASNPNTIVLPSRLRFV